MRSPITTKAAPEPAGPYSQAVTSGALAFISGQIGVDPTTGEIPDSLEAQTDRTLQNVLGALEAAGHRPDDLVKLTVYLSDFDQFEPYNEVFARFFPDSKPARTTVACDLGEGVLIEIDAISSRERAGDG